jgi:hypothetical protein
MGDANAKVGQETVHQPMIGKHSMHESTHENGLRLVDFAAGRQIAIDRRKTRRGAYIDSDHMLVVIKLRARICHANNTNPQQLRRFVVDGLKDRDDASPLKKKCNMHTYYSAMCTGTHSISHYFNMNS